MTQARKVGSGKARRENNLQKRSAEIRLPPATPFGLLYGTSATMQQLYKEIEKVAPSNATVIIVGESGTGKELVAQTLHAKSSRADKPFVPVNCGAIPATLIEAELFGHEKGSFTGALQRQAGYFEYANGGTLFLDEVTEMPLEMQTKLLRVLESGRYHRVGGSEELNVDVRVIAATNRDPYAAVEKGIFREDLFYRLAVFPMHVPPLRERDGDIALLAHHFVNEFNSRAKTNKALASRTVQTLESHHWPGNVRELKNVLYRAFIMTEDVIEVPPPGQAQAPNRGTWESGQLHLPVGITLADAQREIILAVLQHFDGDKRTTAKVLGISLKTLYNRLESYQGSEAISS